MPLVSRTRATLRSAEFGFFGVVVYTRVQTPRRWGAPLSAGVLPLAGFDSRPFRTSCWIVGTKHLSGNVLVLRVWGRAAARPNDNATGGGAVRQTTTAARETDSSRSGPD